MVYSLVMDVAIFGKLFETEDAVKLRMMKISKVTMNMYNE